MLTQLPPYAPCHAVIRGPVVPLTSSISSTNVVPGHDHSYYSYCHSSLLPPAPPRSCISTMDVVPRQSYVSGIVPAEERTATMGITNIVRSLGAACGPLVTGYLSAGGHFG